jgi:hypothetical protein
MQLLAPDLLVDMRELPLAALLVVTLLGLAVWATGWWTHRFWIALGATLTAGIVGLRMGHEIGLQPIVAGLLAAVGAGCVGLALGRIVVFSVYGLAGWYLVHQVGPQFEVPLACFLVGGLVSVLFYRFSVMLLSSAVGAILLTYGGLILAEQFVHFDAVRWVGEQQAHMVNGGFGILVILGLAAQHFVGKAKSWYNKRKLAWQEFQKKQQVAKTAPPKPAFLRLFSRFSKTGA